MKYYYYSEKEQQFGPFTIEELKTIKIKKTTLVWTEGMTGWLAAENVNELIGILISEPPPLPQKPIEITNKPIEVKEVDSKYDESYKKDIDAAKAGIFLIIINIGYFIYYTSIQNQISTAGSYEEALRISNESFLTPNALGIIGIISFLLRICVVIWVTLIAKTQNRNQTKWGFLGFFFPSIALTVIGLSKKLKYKIRVEQSATKVEQYKKLTEQAQYFLKEKRNNDALQIYKYVSKNYKMSSSDTFELAVLGFLNKNYKEAEVLFNKIADVIDYSDLSNYYLGFIAIKNNDLATAEKILSIVSEQIETDSSSLLNTILQKKIDNSPFVELKNKYGLGVSIAYLGEFEFIEGFELFNLTDSNEIKGSINLYWNGILFSFTKDSWKRKEKTFFVSFYLINSIERIEESIFKIQLKDKNEAVFNATFIEFTITPEKINEFEKEFKLAVENFKH